MVLLGIAFGAIYDYCPGLARLIWPNHGKFKEILIYKDLFDEEYPVGSIPQEYFNQTHVCEIWGVEGVDDANLDPVRVSGIFTYDFDIDRWIYCQ